VVRGDREHDHVGTVGGHLVDEAGHLPVTAERVQLRLVLFGLRPCLLRVAGAEDDLVVRVIRPPEREPLADVAGAAE
jgi:Mg2+/Co2+ transporter CorC